jgi:acetyl esterase/lipase
MSPPLPPRVVPSGLLMAVAAALPAQASLPSTAPPATVRTVEDEQYSEQSPDRRRNRLDLYLPPAAADGKAPPLVMFVHGGGWMGGSKELHKDLGKAFAERGFACAVINYRLAPIAKWPAHVDDCALALAWLVAHAGEFGYDAENVFLMGHSAGGHLVSLLALDGELQKANGIDAGRIRGVVALSGVYDVRAQHPLFEQVFGKEPRDRARASPTIKAHRGAPPFLLRWGEKDMPGLGLSAALFAQRLKQCDVVVDAAELRGEDHVGYVYRFGGKRDVIGEAVLGFLRGRVLAGKAAPGPGGERPMQKEKGKGAEPVPAGKDALATDPAGR